MLELEDGADGAKLLLYVQWTIIVWGLHGIEPKPGTGEGSTQPPLLMLETSCVKRESISRLLFLIHDSKLCVCNN